MAGYFAATEEGRGRNIMSDQSYRNCLFALTGGLFIFFCLACLGVVVVSGGVMVIGSAIASIPSATPPLPTLFVPTSTPTSPATQAAGVSPTPAPTQAPIEQPTETAAAPTPRFSPPNVQSEPATAADWEALERLWQTDYPYRDYYENAIRLDNLRLESRTVAVPPYSLGQRQIFIVDGDEVEAVLVAATEHVYFWIEAGLDLEPAAVDAAAQRFEREYYHRVTGLFGEEWRPGMDNDPHFSILHLSDTGGDELGYFDSADQYPAIISQESNEQEIFYLNLGSLDLGEDLYFGTMVHEYQHLIQWWLDPNETGWLNEGLSQLTETYVGLDTVEFADYLDHPETQLNTWSYDPDDEDAVYAHYAASYLFCLYLWEQLGDEAIRELARHPGDGLAGVRVVLQGYRPDLTLEQLLGNFAAAVWLDNPSAGSAYQFNNQRLNQPSVERRINSTPTNFSQSLAPYGINYLSIRLDGPHTVRFAGDTTAQLISAPPPSGEKMWLAPAVDEMNAQLSTRFDLTGLTTATLEFWAWYDLEEDYDYAYITASTDNGNNWDLLFPDHYASGEYGPAFNGQSAAEADATNEWVRESINLNQYAGQELLLRFEVMTDGSVTGRGFALDDLSIPELNYHTDFETDDPLWTAKGFVWTGWEIPVQWNVQLIQEGTASPVVALPLDTFNQGEWTVEVTANEGVLAIMPLVPFVYEPVVYWVEVE